MTKRIKSDEINYVSDTGTGNDIKVRVGYCEAEKGIFKAIMGVALERLPEDYTVKEVNISHDKRYIEVVGEPLKSLL